MAQRRPHYLVKYPRLRKPIPRNHQECLAFLQKHIFLWRRLLGENLLGIGYYDRFSLDDTYRNFSLSVTVLISEHLLSGIGGYGERLASGKWLTANYKTEAEYLEPWTMLDKSWWLTNAVRLTPLYKRDYIGKLAVKCAKIRHPRQNYLIRASEEYIEVREVLPELIAELTGVKDRSIISSRINHLIIHIVKTLAYLNERPFVGQYLCDFAQETRGNHLKLAHFDQLADLNIQGYIWDLSPVQGIAETVVVKLGELIQNEIKKETEFSTTETPFRVPAIPD